MTIAELLKARGIADDVIAQIQEDMKSNKIFTASEENLDIRYGKLKTDHEGVTKQLGEANTLIEELKKSNKGNEGLQQKVTEYETQINQLQAELKEAQIDGEVNVALLAAGVKPDDIDYVTFKLKQKGALELDDNGKIKGMDDKIAALKTQLPGNFEGAAKKNIIENHLPDRSDSDKVITKEEFAKMGYSSRVEFKMNNPEQYSQMMKG